MGSIRVIRWIIVALSAALAIALIARGNLILGVIIGALAVSRAALLIRMQSRRRQFRRRVRRSAPVDVFGKTLD
jgi:Flp pilus assembly protein TadB